ncbi:MAG: hypothetical protein P8X57_04940 [Cyclobacteriaceae bacterium]
MFIFPGVIICKGQVKKSRYIHVGNNFTTEGIPKVLLNSEKKISDAEFEILIKKHNRVHLIPEYNRYGEPALYFVDTSARIVQRINPDKRTPPGELLPPFTMTGFNEEVVKSEQFRGKKVILLFRMYFERNFFNEKWFDDLNNLQTGCSSCEFIMLTGSTKEEIMEMIGAKEIDFYLIPNSRGFVQRYSVNEFPSAIILDENGAVISYLSGIDMKKINTVINQ